MSVTELFANQPFTTVISGGTDPDTGSEFWTVSSSTPPFPTAQTGISQFHVTDIDTTAASEIILVTNVDPVMNIWTVTRGAEGTQPVAHQPGFTITQVLTAGWLNDVAGSNLPAPSAGAILYGNPDADAAWLAGPTVSTREFLASTGAGGTANSPAWGTLATTDIPNPLNQNTTGTAGNVTGIVAVLNGGTGGTTATAYAVIVGGTSPTTSFQSVAGLGAAGQALTSNGTGARPTWQQTFTGLMEPLASPVTASGSPYAAAAGQYVPVDTTSGNVTVTLPSGAADKAIVGINHVIQGGTNAVTWVATGGAVINKTGGGTQGTLPLPSQGVIAQYAAAGTIWYVYADDLPLSQLDLRYLQQAGGTISGNLAVAGTTTTASLSVSGTITSGTWAGSTIAVGEGGTGKNSLTTYAILAGGTASTTPVQQITAGTSGQVLTGNGAGTLPSFQPNVGFTNPMASLGDTIYGGAAGVATQLPGGTTAAKQFLTQTGNGTISAAPQWGTIAAGDVPVLNQNTTGTAGGLSTILAITSGGTGQGSQQAALNALAGGTTPSGDYLRANGTNVTLSTLQATDLTGNVTISHGGTGAGNQQAALNALAGGTVPAGDYLRANGTNVTLSALQAGDLTGTVAVVNGGTGGTQATAYAVVIGGTASTTPFQTVSGTGSSGQVLTSAGASALPAWQGLPAAGASTGGTITLDGDLGNTAASPQVVSTHLASALPVLQGGTGGTQATAYAIVTGGTAAATPFQQVAGLGTAGQGLVSNGAGSLPAWQTMVNSVNAADTSIFIAGTGAAPTVASPRIASQAAKYGAVTGQPPRESIPFWGATTNVNLSSGVMYLVAVPVVPGDVISNIGFQAGSTGATYGTAGFHWWTALYSSVSGTTASFIAQSADQANAAIAGASAHMLALGAGAPYTVPPGTGYVYAAMMINVGTGGTPVAPTMRSPSLNAAQVDASTSLFPTSIVYAATNGTGLGATAPAGTISLTVGVNLIYMGAD